jgi:putative transposase
MDKEFCCGVIRKAVSLSIPEIFNSDQGSQFTSKEFIDILENEGIKISMDGVGRCFDNIRIERLRRTIKYEDIYLHDYQTVIELYHGLSLYIEKYNNRRLHSSLGNKTPSEIYETKH